MLDLLNKLYSSHRKDKENSAPKAEAVPARKKNFLERKRFVEYERPKDSDTEEEQPAKPADDKKDELNLDSIVSTNYVDI